MKSMILLALVLLAMGLSAHDLTAFVDLRCVTDAELAQTVGAIRAGAEEYVRRSDLQFSFMEKHERVAEGVVRIAYSNGAVMTVNYNDRPYGDVPALDYRITRREKGQ